VQSNDISSPSLVTLSGVGAAPSPGPAGPAGTPGRQGPPGEVELVTCTTRDKTVRERVHGRIRIPMNRQEAALGRRAVTRSSCSPTQFLTGAGARSPEMRPP